MTAPEADAVSSGGRALGVTVGDDALSRIGDFLELLQVWNARLRLTGTRDTREIVSRHVVDSLAPVRHLPSSGLLVDVGSGGGFPGIIVACLRPGQPLALVESRRRAANFLREVARALRLEGVDVMEMRAEAAARTGLGGRAAAVLGRGLRLDVFLALAKPLLDPEGLAIAMQTPRTAQAAAYEAARVGLRVLSTHAYLLPGHGSRTLVVAGRLRDGA